MEWGWKFYLLLESRKTISTSSITRQADKPNTHIFFKTVINTENTERTKHQWEEPFLGDEVIDDVLHLKPDAEVGRISKEVTAVRDESLLGWGEISQTFDKTMGWHAGFKSSGAP